MYDEMTVIYGGQCESMALAAIVPYCDDPKPIWGDNRARWGSIGTWENAYTSVEAMGGGHSHEGRECKALWSGG